MVWSDRSQTVLGVMLAVLCVVVIVVGILVYYLKHRRREQRVSHFNYRTLSRKKYYKNKLEMKILVNYFSKNFGVFGKEIKEVYTEKYDHSEEVYVFNIEDSNELATFTKIRMKIVGKNKLKFNAVWRDVIPYALDIRTKKYLFLQEDDEISIPNLSEFYHLFSKNPEIWEMIFSDKILREKFMDMAEKLDYIYVREEYVEAIVFDEQIAIDIINLFVLIEKNLREKYKSLDILEIETIYCYNCNDKIDPSEEICDKCGSPKPICLVCHLDLKPSEKEDVVKLPCCGVYAHQKHIISWLKIKKECPNCQTNLKSWFRLINVEKEISI